MVKLAYFRLSFLNLNLYVIMAGLSLIKCYLTWGNTYQTVILNEKKKDKWSSKEKKNDLKRDLGGAPEQLQHAKDPREDQWL